MSKMRGKMRSKEQLGSIKLAIKARYVRHKNIAAFADELGIAESYLYKIAGKMGLDRPASKKKNSIKPDNTSRYKPVNDAESTTLRPGAPGKVEVLAQRVQNNQPLFVDGDYGPSLT